VAPVLADYYVQIGSRQGVDAILQSDFSEQYAPGVDGNMMDKGKDTEADDRQVVTQ